MEQSDIFNILKSVGDEIGLPVDVWFPIAMSESGLNPYAHKKTSAEDSRGIFQVNLKAHPNANGNLLFNPEYNARYQMPELKKYYDRAVKLGLSGVDIPLYVERYGQRPEWTPEVANNIIKNYSELTGKTEGTTSPSKSTTTFEKLGVVSDVKSEIGKTVDNVLLTAKTGFIFAGLFILLVFAIYMVFAYKGGNK